MAAPERQTLSFEINQQGKPIAIHLDPNCFSSGALREIINHQIYNPTPKGMVAHYKGQQTMRVDPHEFEDIRRLPPIRRREFVERIIKAVQHSDELILRRAPPTTEKDIFTFS